MSCVCVCVRARARAPEAGPHMVERADATCKPERSEEIKLFLLLCSQHVGVECAFGFV